MLLILCRSGCGWWGLLGRIRWARPSYGAVHDFLTNPAYAGAFVFGRKRREKRVDRDGQVRVRDVEVALEQWSVCLPEHHPGYVSWDEYLQTRQRLRANVRPRGGRSLRRPVPRDRTRARSASATARGRASVLRLLLWTVRASDLPLRPPCFTRPPIGLRSAATERELCTGDELQIDAVPKYYHISEELSMLRASRRRHAQGHRCKPARTAARFRRGWRPGASRGRPLPAVLVSWERSQARRWIDSATHEADEANAALDEALAIIQGCHATYMAADSELRRLMNQAIFTRLLVRTDELEGETAPVFGHIRSLSGSSTPVRAKGPRNGQDPRLSGALVPTLVNWCTW
jgi:hypothetical protein